MGGNLFSDYGAENGTPRFGNYDTFGIMNVGKAAKLGDCCSESCSNWGKIVCAVGI